MKHYIKISLILLIGFITFSCDTNDELLNNEENLNLLKKNESLKSVLNAPVIKNPIEIDRYIENPNDLDDEKINSQLLDLALVSRDMFVDKNLNSLIISTAKRVENNSISFTDIISKSNNKDCTNLTSLLQNLDLTHKSQNPMNRGAVENYIPAIFVPNIEIADVDKQPIISSGIEVNSDLEGMEEYEDYIVAWYFENGEWVEFLLNEDTAMKTTNPIFIVDNAEEEITKMPRQKIENSSQESDDNRTSTITYYSHRYKINKRYESSGRSELYITGYYISPSTTGNILKDGNYYDTKKKLAKVRKRWIGDWRWQYTQCGQTRASSYTFWNTYERDWNRSPKNLGTATRYGKTVYLSGKRHYDGEWYAYAPNQVNSHPLLTVSSRYYTNSKGGLLIQNH